MYLLTLKDGKDDGAYAVQDNHGNKVLFLFEEEDDAMRYSMQLEELDYPLMHVIEIDDELMVHTCETHGHRYTIISKNDIVIPPDKSDDTV